MSSSFRQFKAVDYASHKTGAKTLWTINVPKGANAIDIREFSTKPYEYELLFNKGQKLRIHDIDYDEVNNVWKINAELVI